MRYDSQITLRLTTYQARLLASLLNNETLAPVTIAGLQTPRRYLNACLANRDNGPSIPPKYYPGEEPAG